jgi:nucleotide-binding universal stress UspA family protein
MLTLPGARTVKVRVSDDRVLAVGDTVTAIVETAANKACDVIILGAEPYRGWKRLLYEHMAKAVLANTTRPVLLVNRLVTHDDEWL